MERDKFPYLVYIKNIGEKNEDDYFVWIYDGGAGTRKDSNIIARVV